MPSKDYKGYFVPNGAIYLSTVGYGPGALLGAGWKAWRPFIVASDMDGNCLFARENKRISANLHKAYEGTKPATRVTLAALKPPLK